MDLQNFFSLGSALDSLMHYWETHVNGRFLVLHSWYFSAICCCYRSLVAIFMMLSLGACFCCCCRSFAVLVMLYHINLVLSAAANIYCWLSWARFCFCCRSFAVLAVLYRVNLVLPSAAGFLGDALSL
ncbi:hypothetical protein MAM1_0142d06425 [Mucor ambiguus]|uniref:Uncharacterized protein n=1 Tax=Mucor ambiguus TaxID=91626 RepID=A0A0C9LVK5_9FUNG|nr:hypothetical protein MAM1_0142d06425 [Mucor ambiguus]